MAGMAVVDLSFFGSPPCLGSLEASLLGFSSTRLTTTPRENVVAFKYPSRTTCQVLSTRNRAPFSQLRRLCFRIPRCTGSSSSDVTQDEKSSSEQTKTPFGYTRKDVLLIGLGVTVIGFGLKSGLEYAGVDPLLAGNVVQLVVVLGLTIGWISTYMFRVSNKEMTYAQQLRDYGDKVMQKRLEGLTETELEALLKQVEEEKRQLTSSEQAQ